MWKKERGFGLAVVVVSLLGSTVGLEAQVSVCEGGPGYLGVAETGRVDWVLRLPESQQEIVCEAQMDFLEEGTGPRDPRNRVRTFGFRFDAEGSGPFEAVVEVDFNVARWPDDTDPGNDVLPFGIVRTETGGRAGPPETLVGGRGSRRERHQFMGHQLYSLMLFDGLLNESGRPTGMPPRDDGLWGYDITVGLRMILRRVKDRCFMVADVSGGSGAGTYSGDVAVLGNPTGVSDATLDMWFQTEEGEVLDTFEDAWGSQAGEQMREQMTEEQAAQLQALYRQMGAGAEEADPVREIREMLTLTLEDVRFDEDGPSAEADPSAPAVWESRASNSPLEALAHMANKFVLVAQLAGDGSVLAPNDQTASTLALPVKKVGLKGPGLGLASSESSCGDVPSASLLIKPCEGDRWLELDQMGAVCGDLVATVYNEKCEKLDVEAEFLAGRSVEQCIY